MFKLKNKLLFRLVCVIIGSGIVAINIQTLVKSAGLFPGGFSGLAILLQQILKSFYSIEISYTLLNAILNFIPALVAYRFVGKKFTFFSILALILTSILVDAIPVKLLTGDPILYALFGGIVNGIGILVLLKGDLSSGGTDFLALAASNKWKISTWNYVLIFNACIIVISGILFDWNKALYSILFQFCSIQVINTFHRRYKKVCLFIISEKYQEIGDALIADVHHGVTKFSGTGCYSNAKKEMLYTVVSEEQLSAAIKIIRKIDNCAFVNAVKTEQLNGLFHIDPFE